MEPLRLTLVPSRVPRPLLQICINLMRIRSCILKKPDPQKTEKSDPDPQHCSIYLLVSGEYGEAAGGAEPRGAGRSGGARPPAGRRGRPRQEPLQLALTLLHTVIRAPTPSPTHHQTKPNSFIYYVF